MVELGADIDRRHGLRSVGVEAQSPGRREQPGRRWDDRPSQFPALTFARFLEERPTVDDIARFLVALLCWPVGAQGVLVTRMVDGRRPRLLGSYVEQVPDWPEDGELPADVLGPATEVGHRPVLRTDVPDVRPVAAWPLGSPGHAVGTLIVILSEPLEPRLVELRTAGIADILGVYLVASGSDGSDGAETSGHTAVMTSDLLTVRQVEILSLMGQDLTNAQIARRIGFSASTVRMESLTIYRALGVHDRQHAVTIAHAAGVIDHA